MSKKQKAILIIFLVFDILIVTLLAGTIVKTWSLTQVTRKETPLSHCADAYLKALQDSDQQIAFAMEKDVIYITVSILAEKDKNEFDDSQMLWTLLDQLGTVAVHTTDICPNPQTMILQINIVRDVVAINHQAIIPMPDLLAWSQGTVSENQLTENIRYRQASVSSE